MSQLTQILSEIEEGDSRRADDLLPLVYDELRKLAVARLQNEKPGQTLQATALVHEAFLRLVGNDVDTPWNSRGHFFGAAAEAMRRILVEKARHKRRVRHGGELNRVAMDLDLATIEPDSEQLLLLHEALERLERLDENRARVVKLRFFAGLTIPEVARAMNISVATAERYWSFARTWLFAEMSEEASSETSEKP